MTKPLRFRTRSYQSTYGKQSNYCLVFIHFILKLFITVMDKLRLEIRAMDEVGSSNVCL